MFINQEARPLGRRYLKSFASGIAYQFLCSCEHYAYMAYQHRVRIVEIDLLTLRISPDIFCIDRNLNLARICQRTLYRSIEWHAMQNKLTAAVIRANFGIDTYTAVPDRIPTIGKSTFTVILTDDRGKEWKVELIDENPWATP